MLLFLSSNYFSRFCEFFFTPKQRVYFKKKKLPISNARFAVTTNGWKIQSSLFKTIELYVGIGLTNIDRAKEAAKRRVAMVILTLGA